MGSGSKPGPLCSSKIGRGAIDAGTNCRAASPKPGPMGLDAGTSLDASDAGADALDLSSGDAGNIVISFDKGLDKGLDKLEPPKSDSETKKKISAGIKLLWASPLASTDAGKKVIKLVTDMNRQGLVIYSEMDSFGEWDGKFIYINNNFSFEQRDFETAIELAHEGTHALWRSKHPIKTATTKSAEQKAKEDIQDEFDARRNQLKVYRFLKEKRGFSRDSVYTNVMDRRLHLLEDDRGLLEEIKNNWHH